MEYTKDEKTALWLDGLHIDYARRAKLLAPVRAPYALVRRFSAYAEAVRGVVGEETFARMERSLSSPAFMRGLLTRYAEKGITAVTYYSEGYPAQLKELARPGRSCCIAGEIFRFCRRACSASSVAAYPACRAQTHRKVGGRTGAALCDRFGQRARRGRGGAARRARRGREVRLRARARAGLCQPRNEPPT